MELTPEQGEELWEAWNLGGPFLVRALFPDVCRRWQSCNAGISLGNVDHEPRLRRPKFSDELREFELDKFFEAMVVSCDVGYLKPHPRMYQDALEARS